VKRCNDAHVGVNEGSDKVEVFTQTEEVKSQVFRRSPVMKLLFEQLPKICLMGNQWDSRRCNVLMNQKLFPSGRSHQNSVPTNESIKCSQDLPFD
jgi:hypothetical protein